MSELPCFKCGRNVPPKRATHTRDGKIACPGCTKQLGIRIEPRDGFVEITRMKTREEITVERNRAKTRAEDARNSNPRGDAETHEQTVAVLEWVLGEDDTKPSEVSREDQPQESP